MKNKLHRGMLVILAASLPVLAQQSSPQILNIGVWDFEVQELSPSNAQALSNLVRVDLVKLGKFNIVDRGNMQKILQEQGFQQTGCTSQECVVEVGKLLGVQKMISGNISKLGQLFIINLQLTDIATGKIEKLEQEQFSGMIEQLPEPMNRLTLRLVGETVIETKETAFYISSVPQGGSVYIEDRFIGNAPLKVKATKPIQNIRVTAKGYADWAQNVPSKDNETVIVEPHLVELKGIDATGIDIDALVKEAGRRQTKYAVAKMDSLYMRLNNAVRTSLYGGTAVFVGFSFVILDFEKLSSTGLLIICGGGITYLISAANENAILKKINVLKGEYNIPLTIQSNGKQILLGYQLQL